MGALHGFALPKGGAYAAKNVPGSRVAGNPTMRDDHLCVIDECRKPLPRVAVKHEDPFCSTTCCRAWHAERD